MKYIGLNVIRLYQKIISPYLGKNCRFYPSCSEYTYQSIESHGIIKGSYFGLKQILCCHPFYHQKKSLNKDRL